MVKKHTIQKLLPLAFLMTSAVLLQNVFAQNASAQTPVYELRTYTAVDGKLDAVIARFRDQTIPIFNKHGMQSVGYFTPQDKKNTLVYILKHPSRELGEKHWTEFQADPEWKKVQAETEANGKIVDKVERVWLDPTAFSMLK